MKATFKTMRPVGRIVLMLFGIFAFNTLLMLVTPPHQGYDLLLYELETGFVTFLSGNIQSMSFDAGTWGPGLGAFLIALAFGHRFLSRWAQMTNRHWTFATSLCVFLIFPACFAISFIIPGVLLQWEMLRQVPWIEINR